MKASLIRRRGKNPPKMPGTIEPPKGAAPTTVVVHAYDAERIEEIKNPSIAAIAALRGAWPMIWIDVTGLTDAKFITELADQFGLHKMAMEDVMNTPQRSKLEEFGDHLFIIARMVEKDGASQVLDQLSLFWGTGFIITFQERPGDCFGPLRDRLKKGGRRNKMLFADYMAYALLDAVIDGYFPVLEEYGDRLETIEDLILKDSSDQTLMDLHKAKRELHTLRLCLWPMRDVISKMRTETDLMREETLIYMRDCQDHIIQILEIIESYRERVSALNDLYLSSASNRLNEVMKVLTVISTIFMPLSFVVGLYGMNFDTAYPTNMPELRQPYGYIGVLIFMGLMSVIMLLYFFRLGWIFRRKK